MQVFIVGAGPGDPELITVKGQRLLKKADVIIYAGSLVNPALLNVAKAGAEIFNSASMTLPEVIEKIIDKERPDAILPTLGGQTALNAAISLDERGILKKYGVELIGANIAAINLGEDREAFKGVVERAGGESARSIIVHSMEEALEAAQELGYPMVVRPSFTMGGLGSGMAYNLSLIHI